MAPDVWGWRVAGGGAAAIVEEAGRHAGRLKGGTPRRAPAADGDAVAVEDRRAIGITARQRRDQLLVATVNFPFVATENCTPLWLAGGALRCRYGATGGTLSLPTRDHTVWARMQALGWSFWGRSQVKQGEPEVLHARDRVGQTLGATQRDLKPGCRERIGNSRRTGTWRINRRVGALSPLVRSTPSVVKRRVPIFENWSGRGLSGPD